MTKTAKDKAEALAERLRKSPYHEVTIKSAETDLGTFWSVTAIGRHWVDNSLMGVTWLQHKPGKQGRQVKFCGGLAAGYGDCSGKTIEIKTAAQLEMWMYVCIEASLRVAEKKVSMTTKPTGVDSPAPGGV